MKLKHGGLLAGVVFALCAAGVFPVGTVGGLLSPPLAQAQNLGQRVVNGSVVDAGSTPVPGATVFLKDLKNKLYEAMLDDEISFYEGYELAKLLPANEKKEIKRQQKIEKFSQVLSKEIDTEQETVNDLAEKLSVI